MTSRLKFYQALFAFSFAPHMIENPIWVSITVVILIAISVRSGQLNRPLLSKNVLRAGALLSPVLILLQFKTIIGAEAATPLLCLMVGLKLNEMRDERDEMVILILCVLIVMNWLLFSQSLLTTLYMGAVLLAVGLGLMLIQSPKKSLRDLVSGSSRVLFRDIIIAVPVFLAFFFLFPRFSSPIGNFFGPPAEEIGFVDSLTPGKMANLIASEEIAFRVIFKDRMPRQQLLYWQGKILEDTDGWAWSHPQDQTPIQRRMGGVRFRRQTPQEDGDRFVYEMVLEPRFGETVFYLEKPVAYEMADSRGRNVIIVGRSGLEAAAPVAYRLKINGEAQPFWNAQEELPPPDRARNLLVPFRPSGELQALVETFKRAGPPDAISQSVLNYFAAETFVYSTETPEMAGVEEFLLRYKTGFCEHYASAFAMIMRMAGVPARVIVGFQGGEYNNFGDYMVVRDKNAHSWAEIYIDGRGWTRVDPTSVVSSGRIGTGQYATAFFGGLDRRSGVGAYLSQGLAFFESLNSRYILFLLDYDADYQAGLFSFGGALKVTRGFLFGVFVAIAVVFSLTAFLWGRKRSLSRDRTSEAFARLLNYFARFGYVKKPAEGALTFIERVQEAEGARAEKNENFPLKIPTSLVFRYINIRYSPEGHSDRDSFIEDCLRFLKGK